MEDFSINFHATVRRIIPQRCEIKTSHMLEVNEWLAHIKSAET